MKKLFLLLVLVGLFIMPATADADFFNDGRPYMASSQWELLDFSVSLPEGVTAALTDVNNRLEFTAGPAWYTGEEASIGYASLWQFDLGSDFDITVDFHYNHAGSFSTDSGGVGMALYYFDEEYVPYSANIFAQNWYAGEEGNMDVYMIETNIYGLVGEGGWTSRNSSDGRLRASYTAGSDTLTLEAQELMYQVMELGDNSGYMTVASASYSGLSGETSSVGVYLGGYSTGSELVSGDAHLENFQVNVVPEPISSTLFLIGGATLGFRKLRKRG